MLPPNGYWRLFPWPGHEADHPPPSSTKVKNMWSYTSTLSYVLVAWCFKYRLSSWHGTWLSIETTSYFPFTDIHEYNVLGVFDTIISSRGLETVVISA